MSNNVLPDNLRKEDGHGSQLADPSFVKQASEIVASTSTPLAAGAEYGASEPFIFVGDAAYVQIQVESLQPYDSTAYTLGTLQSGFAVQVSLDGVNVYKTFPITTANNPPNESLYFERSYPYVRPLYTNGATPQTEFYLATSKHQVFTGPPVRSIGSPFNNSALAMNVRAVVAGQPETGGNFRLVQLSKDDALFVANSNRLSEVKGRAHVDATGVATGAVTPISQLIYTVPSGRRLWMTSVMITGTNVLTTGGILTVTDGAGGTVKMNIVVAPGTNQTKQGVSMATSFDEPIPFTNTVHLNIPATGVGSSAAITFTGYLEDV